MTTELHMTKSDMTESNDSRPQTAPLHADSMGDDASQVQHDSDRMDVDATHHTTQNDQDDNTQPGSLHDTSHNEVDPVPDYGEERPEYDPDSLFIPERDPTPPSNLRRPTSEDVINPSYVSVPGPGPVPTPTPSPAPNPMLKPTPTPAPAPAPRSCLTARPASVKDLLRGFHKRQADKKQNRSKIQGARVNANLCNKQSAPDDDESANRKAEEEFERKKQHFDELREKYGGNLPFALDIEWIRIQSNEQARLNKRNRDIAKAREDEDDNPNASPTLEPTQDPDEDQLSDSGVTQYPSHNHISMQNVELDSMRVAIEAQNDDPSNKRKKKAKGPEDKAKPKRVRKRKETTAAKKVTKRQSKKKKKEIDNAAKQASSLLYSNIFSEQAGPDSAEQPFFTSSSSTRKQALKELIASVPREDEKQARCDASQLTKAAGAFHRMAVKPDANGSLWLVKGMKTSLKPYQLLGSAFMRKRENDVMEPRGGLLADQMGLGKTLMTLANIHDGKPPKNSKGPKTTLIVASPALLSQWKSEIERHSSIKLSTITFSQGKKLDSTDYIKILKDHDIVLATYTEVMRSHPKYNPPLSCETDEQKRQWWYQRYETGRGDLHRIHFLRIVLDEAQAIKNHLSLTSIACRALSAEHKWALSGTPILNGLAELYPYFKFIGVPQTGDYESFKEYYCNPKDPERLLLRLSQFMLRRTHADEMFGAPILKLPQANQSTYWCHFNSVERCIYDIVHERFIERIKEYMNKKTLNRSYNNILVMMLRLRQLTAHILMLQFVVRDLLEMRDIERIKEVAARQAIDSSTQSGKTIIAVRKQLEKLAEDEKKRANKGPNDPQADGSEAEHVDEDDIDDEDPEIVHRYGTGGKFGTEYNFKPFLNSLKTGESWEKAKRTAKCGACGKRPTHPMITSCGHLICIEPCYSEACMESAESSSENPACKTCGKIPQFIEQCDPADFEESDRPGTRSNARKKKEKLLKRPYRDDIEEDWLASVGDDVLPSAKTIAVKSQIMNWLKEDPNVKIIVYTQFLAMVRILTRVCQNEGWKPLQYHGKMSLPARDNAIRAFTDDKDAKILLASMRCGGLGLNLTMASRVIVIDPWWNSATEQQAFCRVFRIGQNQETYMSRLCVKATVDEKLMQIQERKGKEIEQVMKEGGKLRKTATLPKLMELFGISREEGDGADGLDDEVHDDGDTL